MASSGDLSLYHTAFPQIPRTNGIAKVTSGSSTDVAATVRIVTKDAMKAAYPADSAAAAADAEREGLHIRYEGSARDVFVAAGKKLTVDGVRKAVVTAINKAKALKLTSVQIELPTVEGSTPAAVAEVIVQAATLTNYHFDRYLTKEVPTLLQSIHIVSTDATVATAVRDAATLAECTIFSRDLGNERADEMHPTRLQHEATRVATEIGAQPFVLRGTDELVPAGLHLLHAVGQAARHPPRYVEFLYKGDPDHPEDVIAVVGKGVCFDSGGLNIKGTGFMEDMHLDMAGSSAVLGTALAVHRLGIRRNVVFVIGAVENSVDALSYKPHNIIRSHKGYTVEVNNTDAEGRLVLADALSLVQQRHRPHTIIDMATLTGACVIALGEYAAGVFSNSKALTDGLVAAGTSVFERCWPMPILPEHRDELTTSPFADLRSTGAGRMGGACIAAAFLENFIGYSPAKNARDTASAAATPAPEEEDKPAWAHIDLAGPAMYSRERGHMKQGGTGYGVQLVTTYIRNAPAGRLAKA